MSGMEAGWLAPVQVSLDGARLAAKDRGIKAKLNRYRNVLVDVPVSKDLIQAHP